MNYTSIGMRRMGNAEGAGTSVGVRGAELECEREEGIITVSGGSGADGRASVSAGKKLVASLIGEKTI